MQISLKYICLNMSCSASRSIGVFDKKDTDEGSRQEREEEEHKQGIAKHDVFGMSVKAKDVSNDGDVRALDTSMQVTALCKVHSTATHRDRTVHAVVCISYYYDLCDQIHTALQYKKTYYTASCVQMLHLWHL